VDVFHEFLDRYEATGDEAIFEEAKRAFEAALDGAPDPNLLAGYGYLLECHGRTALRQAVELYERAIDLDPVADKPRYQLILARAALLETEQAVALYQERLAAAPDDVREYRFLASAYLAAHEYHGAATAVDAGLALAPDDRTLIEARGNVRAATGDPEGALADWRHAIELDPEQIGPLYGSAFLLEREGRLEEAAQAWRSVVAWHEARGDEVHAEWPSRELERVLAK
jgi:tetratricopeptide (TPR) repeat protein